MLQSSSRAFLLDTPQTCAKPGCQPGAQSGLAWLLPAPAARCRQLRPAGHRSREGQRAGVTPAASRHHVAQSAALVDQTIDLGDTMQLSEETERRRRSLEQSYDAAATPDLFDEAHQQQADPSPSQRLERSWQARPGDRTHETGSQPPPQAAQPSSKQRRRNKRSVTANATAATAVAPQPAAAAAAPAPAPAKLRRLPVGDKADRSDHQLLHGAQSAGGRGSLAVQRAARRHTDQGRVSKRQVVRPQQQRQQLDKRGPAEAFLTSLQERLYNSRNAKRAAGTDAVSWYLSTVGNTTVLTRNEEAQLGAIIHLGSAVKRAQQQLQADDGTEASLDEVARHLKLRSAATVQQRVQNAALAKTLLTQYNVRLVVSVARQYSDRGVEFPDLLPAGVAGLERAIARFDASKGFKFSTYAHWWIRQAISRCVQDQSRVVRLPVNVYELLSKINKVGNHLNAQPDRQKPATYAEIARALDMPVAKVMQVVRASREAKSLDTPVDQSGSPDAADSPALVDTLAADLGDAAEDSSQRALREQVDLALKGLDLRPRNILRYRYGLHTALGRPLTLNEVGDLYGLKGERVRQIEGVAIKMLKKGLQQGLRKTLDVQRAD